jgi:hypothetical protein
VIRKLHELLTLGLDEGRCVLWRKNPRYLRTRGCVGPRAGMEKERKIIAPIEYLIAAFQVLTFSI